MKPVLVFRCDASSEIGTGHVMRCLTLAGALQDCYQVKFLCSEETIKTVPALGQSGFPVSSDEFADAQWLIIDHYNLDEHYERRAYDWASQVMVIDDLANRAHECDILLDQTFGRLEDDYKNLVPASCKILTGSKYAILKPEFALLRQTLFRNFSKPERLLVTFGGLNPKKSTEFTLRVLERFQNWPLQIDVVTGSHAAGFADIESLVARLQNQGFHQVFLHVDTPAMARLMTQADLCIGAGGTTSWERCCLKLPAITFELADNQHFLLEGLAAAGVVRNLGPIESISEEVFFSDLSLLLAAPRKLEAMSLKAAAICDGRGIARIQPFLLPPVKFKDDRCVRLRPMHAEDCQQLFQWQSIPEVRAYARNPEVPSWKDHQAWFFSALDSERRQLFIVEYEGKPAGMVRLDALEEILSFEVSIIIDPQYHRSGIGVAALSLLRILWPEANFMAEVLKGNSASQKLFEKAGYIPVSDTWYLLSPDHKGKTGG